MNNIQKSFSPTTAHAVDHLDLLQAPVICPLVNVSRGPKPPRTHLDGNDLDAFLERHAALSIAGKRTFEDMYRDFSDQQDLFLLSDESGRLITLHASATVMRSANDELGLRYGALLNETQSGSSAIAMALRYRQAMVSTNSSNVESPLHLWVTVAVPFFDERGELNGCVAILNSGEGSLGEKLLLAKFVVRELTRVLASEAGTSGQPSNAERPARADAEQRRLFTGQAWNRPERRRGEDRRRARHAAAAGASQVKLTRRQQQVLELFAQGKGYKEIARSIGITSYKTVEEHLDAVREKLKVEHRRECIHKAISLGLL